MIGVGAIWIGVGTIWIGVGESTGTLTGSAGHVNFREMYSGSEAGSYLRLIDLCITQL